MSTMTAITSMQAPLTSRSSWTTQVEMDPAQ